MSYSKDNTSTGLRDTGGNTHSGYNPTNPQYGRDTLDNTDNRSGPGNVSSSGMRDKSDMGTTETYPESCPLNPTTGGAYDSSRFGTGVIDPNLSPTNRASTSSGTGIHAQQYRGRAGEYGQGTTTTTTTISSGTTPGVGHHVSHHHHQGHGYAPGDTSTGQTGTGVGMGSTYSTTGMAGTQGTTGTTAGREMGVGQEQQSFEQGAMQHGKPSVMDKIIGGTEKGFGKITSNPAMVQQGAERAAGEFERSSKN